MNNNGIRSQRVPSKGIIIFSILIVLYALHGLPLIGFDLYYTKFYPAPQWLIFCRYILSIAMRVALFVSAAGILFRKDIFRRLILFISFLTVATVYWKHPVSCFKTVLIWKIAQGVLPPEIIPRIDMIAWSCVAICYIVDIIFSVSLIYFFSRRDVKKQFDAHA